MKPMGVFTAGIALGMLGGAVVGNQATKNKKLGKAAKRNAGKAIKTIGNIIEHSQDMFA